MGLFDQPAPPPCQACLAKDQHLAFLQDQVRELQAKLIEVASPGANARLLAQPAPQREVKGPARRTSHNPARLAQLRHPTPAKVTVLANLPEVRADIEASFNQPADAQ